MNATQQGVIALMKSAITGEKVALPEQFDIAQAYPVLRRHSIMAMGYVGALHCGIDKTLPAMQRLRTDYAACLLGSQQQITEYARICQAFEENGIDYMPLKGCNMKQLYPGHELRAMSDADILIRQEQYDAIRPIMERLGFEERNETDHELTWRSKALHVELHKQLVPSGNRDFYRYYCDCWRFAKQNDGHRYAMTAEDAFVFNFTHFTKHYRDFGVGCRHVVDLWVFLSNHPNLNVEYIRNELSQLGLMEFYDNVCHVLDCWFGDSLCDNMVDVITEVVFANGNWGTERNHMLFEVIKQKKKKATIKKSKLMWLLKRVFLPLIFMREQYKTLWRYPMLLPVFWVVRWCKLLFCQREKIMEKYNAIKKTTREDIESHEQALAYVGLGFGE